jgi:hypothetical protein
VTNLEEEAIYVGIPWEHRPRARWDYEEMTKEFRERLYHRLPCPLCRGTGESRMSICQCQLGEVVA